MGLGSVEDGVVFTVIGIIVLLKWGYYSTKPRVIKCLVKIVKDATTIDSSAPGNVLPCHLDYPDL